MFACVFAGMSVSLTVSYGSFFFFRWRYQSVVLSEREFDGGGVDLRCTVEMVVEIGNFTAGLEPEE